MVFQILFWISLLLLGYTFLGYQILICLLAGFRRASTTASSCPPEGLSVLIIAHNEAGRMRARIANLLESKVGIEVVVCSDGSTDATASEARLAGARVIEFPVRRSIRQSWSSPIRASGSTPRRFRAWCGILGIPPLGP